MKLTGITFISLLVMFTWSCQQKKTVEDIYKESKIRIDLSGTPSVGYVPLNVDFSAYLETKNITIERKIKTLKWIITGPSHFRREIVQASENYQDEENNNESFFYLNYVFSIPGHYHVRLLLNDGEFVSKSISVSARDRGQPNNRRF
jgi:hypothetical protein